ncbi:hypothetical protein DFH06DRAFT_67982 [Mycena polygramma]|nr:hypothetical protein DFH06DRAFT_67982 [Mycena polygramma]
MALAHPSLNLSASPRIIPADAQIIPPPPYMPEPPDRVVYGWLLEPALFGPGPLTFALEDKATGEILDFPTEPLERPTTITQAVKAFKLVVIGMRINTVLKVDRPHTYRPRYAYLAEASKGTGVRSLLDGGAKTIPASRLKVLKERLQLVKDPEWMQVPNYLAEDNAELERRMQAVPILNLTARAEAARNSALQMQVVQSL